MKKDIEKKTYDKCGKEVPEQISFSSSGKSIHNFGALFFSAVFSLMLIIFTGILIFLIFFYSLNGVVTFPVSGPVLVLVNSDWIIPVFGAVLISVPLLLIIVMNTKCIRRIFLSVGISMIVTALLSTAAGFLGRRMVKMLSGEWQDTLINTIDIFRDFSFICAIILIIIGASCLSVYSCICAVKGVRYEKNN